MDEYTFTELELEDILKELLFKVGIPPELVARLVNETIWAIRTKQEIVQLERYYHG